MYLAKVLSTRVANLIRYIKTRGYGNRAKEAIQLTQYGIDGNPTDSYVAVYSNTDNDGEPVIVGLINKNAVSEVGGLRLYSENGLIYIRQSGNVEINGNTKSFVKYEDFNTVMQAYLVTLNAAILGGIGGVGGTYVAPPPPNFTAAQTTTVKTG